jgi:hypothetical protein
MPAKRKRKAKPRERKPRSVGLEKRYRRLDPEELITQINTKSALVFGITFKPEFVPQAALLYRKGWTDMEVSEFFGIDDSTLRNWAAACPEFGRVRRDAKDVADERVEQSLYQRALGYDIPTEKVFHTKDTGVVRAMTKTHIPAEVSAARYWLENRDRKRWRNRQEITGADGAPLVAADAPKRPMIEIARRVVYMLQRAEDEQNGGPQPLLIETKVTATEG